MNLKNKIDEYNQNVKELKEKLAQAQKAGNNEDIRLFTDRLHDVAYARYAIKSVYVETICEQFDISLRDMLDRVESNLDISKISDEYNVFVIAEKKT